MGNVMKCLGLAVWIINLAGALVTLVTGEFLGRDYYEWTVAALVGWCTYLHSLMAIRARKAK